MLLAQEDLIKSFIYCLNKGKMQVDLMNFQAISLKSSDYQDLHKSQPKRQNEPEK